MRNRKPPRFTVYHVASTMEVNSFYFQHHALMCLGKLPVGHACTTVEDYENNVVHMVTRRNLMSGEEYQEPSNTPLHMSPASETYWSM